MRLANSAGSFAERWRVQRLLRGCERVGQGASIEGRPTLGTAGRIRIGDRFRLASSPAASHMVTGVEGVLEIGDDVAIGCGAAIAAYARVSIGSGTTIAPYVIILDTDFHRVGDRTGHANSSDIVIGRDVQLGSRVTVLRGSHVGDGAVVAAASVVSGIVPAGARVSGVPARARGERVAGETEGVASVPDIVMRSFALPSAPEPGHGPTEIPGWDSLGALTLLLALEDAFGISLSEDGVVTARTVADLARIVEQAMAAGNE